MAKKPNYDSLLEDLDLDEDVEPMEDEESYVGESAEVDGLLDDVLNAKLSLQRRKSALYDVIKLCGSKAEDDGGEEEEY